MVWITQPDHEDGIHKLRRPVMIQNLMLINLCRGPSQFDFPGLLIHSLVATINVSRFSHHKSYLSIIHWVTWPLDVLPFGRMQLQHLISEFHVSKQHVRL